MISSVRPLGRREQIALTVIVAILGGLLVKATIRGGLDFHVLYLSGQRFLRGEPIYVLSDGWMTYKYHPVWAIAFAAFAPLPERLSFILFEIANFSCWTWAAMIWARWLGYDLRKPSNFLVLLLLAINPLTSELHLGQVNGFLFLGATKLFEWLSADPQRWFRAGFLAAILCSLKLSFGLLLVFCLIRNWRTVAGMIAAALAVHVVTAVSFGGWFDVALYRTWVELCLGQSAQQYVDPDIQGLFRFLLLVTPEYSKPLWVAFVASAISGGIWLERTQRQSPALIAAYWIAAIYLLSPLAWWSQILLTFPLAFFLLKQDIGRTGRIVIYVSLALYALASPTLLGRPGIETFRTAHGFFLATMAIVAVMIMHLWRSSRATADEDTAAKSASPDLTRAPVA